MPATCTTNGAQAFIGTWTLQSYTEQAASLEPLQPFGPEPVGLLIYTDDGMVSAQLMRPGRKELRTDAWGFMHADGLGGLAAGYIAYSGHFVVDESKQEVIHTPIVALIPNLIGQPQHLRFELTGKTLVLETTQIGPGGESSETRLVWCRVDHKG